MSSENYIGTDGFRPLPLPLTGEELLEGRQYCLTPLARLVIREEFGIAGIPTVVVCTRRKVARTTITTVTFNHETKASITRVQELEAQDACFRPSNSAKPFTIDLTKLEERAPFHNNSHKLPEMEAEWFANTQQLPINHKFRGQPLRWWVRGDGGIVKTTKSGGVRSTKKIDLSCLD